MTEPTEERTTSSGTTHVPDFELIVGGVESDGETITYQGEGLQSAADCLRMMEESVRDESDLSEIMEKFRRKTEKGELTGLSSTATTVSSSMASQWISHMKRTFKKHAIALSEEQQQVLKKMVSEELYPQHGPQADLSIRDILMLYSRGLEAYHDGRYREMFERIRPCIPFFNTNVLVWIRISEALIYEFYEEVWEFSDIYTRLFEGRKRGYVSSHRRRCNELRRRHRDMNLRFAEVATLMTFALAKQSSREPVHYSAASLHGFLLLKLKKYTEAIEAVDFVIDLYDREDTWQDELSILITYKAEALIGLGRLTRAIKYCLRVVKETKSVRARHRALMLITMAYMRKNNFKKAYEYVNTLLAEGRLDENMLENVALLGINLAHLMGNMAMFKQFETMLQKIVY